MILFGEKKILKSGFSLDTLSAIRDLPGARQYFITHYFIPIVYGVWQNHNAGQWALLNIVRFGQYTLPAIGFHNEDNAGRIHSNGFVADAIDLDIYKDIVRRTFDVMPGRADLSNTIEPLFRQSMPDGLSGITVSNFPLVASMVRTLSEIPNTGQMKLHVLVKDKNIIKGRDGLLFQGHKPDHVDENVLSIKYKRRYNVITGQWRALCTEDDCVECAAIRNSPAVNSIYDDPEAFNA